MRTRDLILLIVGIVAGYALAQIGPAPSRVLVEPVRSYVATHTVEVLIGVILVGIILTLMGKGGGGRR